MAGIVTVLVELALLMAGVVKDILRLLRMLAREDESDSRVILWTFSGNGKMGCWEYLLTEGTFESLSKDKTSHFGELVAVFQIKSRALAGSKA